MGPIRDYGTRAGLSRPPTLHVQDSFGHSSAARSYLSLLGVWTESCPLVEACGFIIKEVLEGAEDETHVVVRSKLL